MTGGLESAAGVAEAAEDAAIDVVDRQRKRKMDVRRWQVFAVEALREVRAAEASVSRPGSRAVASLSDGEAAKTKATIAFVSERVIRNLNRDFRAKDVVTDVLSFPNEHDADELVPSASDYLGDVVICVAQAERQATENDLSFNEEIAQLILHGLIHLCGYDHATDSGEMNRFELRLRQHLGVG